ncbi:MAG: alpha/beta fold hydrolase [Gammaproteobacteria bacterium]
MPIAPINGIEMYYEQQGQGKDLLLIGGLTATIQEWNKISPALSRSFRVTLPENRGAGRTTAPEKPYNIAQMAEDIVLLMENLNIEKAYFVGSSMGSAIVQQLCLAHRDKVEAAVLISAFAHLPTVQAQYFKITSSILATSSATPQQALTMIYTRLYASSTFENSNFLQEEIDHVLANPYPQTPAGYQGQLSALTTFDIRKQLHAIKTPIKIIVGEEDILTPLYLSQALQQSILGSQLVILKHCAHMVSREQPTRLLKEILSMPCQLS